MILRVLVTSVVGAALLVGFLVWNNKLAQDSLKSEECKGALSQTSYCRN